MSENIKEMISAEIIKSMKAKEKLRLDVLRYVKKLLIENSTSKKPQPELEVVAGHAKKLKSSLEHYPEGGERSLRIHDEITILGEFLPKALSEEEVKAMIKAIIDENAEANFGIVMKGLSSQIKGRFDGKQATNFVKEALG